MTAVRSVVLDVDGTLVDSERDGHRVAFNAAFAEAGLPDRWSPTLYGRLLRVTGGRRRLERYLLARGRSLREASELALALHIRKNAILAGMIEDRLIAPRPGVPELLSSLDEAGADLHVVTTGSRVWVLPLLDSLFGRARFRIVVTGDDVRRLKPHPEAYHRLLRRVGVPRRQVVAVEDSGPGLAAAVAAGIPCVMVTNAYTATDSTEGAARVVEGFHELGVDRLLRAGLDGPS